MNTHTETELPLAHKDNHAITVDSDGTIRRTLWGYMLPEDIDIIAREYPEVPREFVEGIALQRDEDHVETIPAPRLLEVLTVVELLARALRGEWSAIKKGIPEGLRVIANPLSVLSFFEGEVRRLVTFETEMMHKPAEKLALRTGAIDKINQMLGNSFGLQLAYGCSCCALMFAVEDREAVLGSKYYKQREQQGRHWDSDVLAATGRLYGPVSVGNAPAAFLENSVDFGPTEVMSYQRFARVAQACVEEHPNNVVNLNEWWGRAACFVGNQCQKQGDHCPLPQP